MSKTKTPALLIAVILIFSLLFTACATQSDNPTPPATGGDTSENGETPSNEPEPITLKVYRDSAHPDYPSSGTILGNEIKRITGVNIEFEFLVGADRDTKQALMIASGDYPDIIIGDGLTNFYEAGALVRLDDKMSDKYPNLKWIHDTYAPDFRQEDGNTYHIPAPVIFQHLENPATNYVTGLLLQGEVMKELGWPVIETIEEYFEAIAAYMEEYPTLYGQDTIGFVFLFDSWMNYTTKMLPVYQQGFMNDRHTLAVDNVDGQWTVINPHITDTAKYVWSVFNTAYNDGLIHPDSFLLKRDELDALKTQGNVLGSTYALWMTGEIFQALRDDDKASREMIPLPIVAQPGIQEHYLDVYQATQGPNSGVAITTNCKDVDRALAYLDWHNSHEGSILKGWGIEGVHYSITDGQYAYTVEYEDNLVNNTQYWRYEFGNEYWRWMGMRNEAIVDHAPEQYYQGIWDTQYFVQNTPDIIKEFTAAHGINVVVDLFNAPIPESNAWNPLHSVSSPPGSAAQIAAQKMDEAMEGFIPRLVMAKPGDFEKEWAAYVDAMEKSNYQHELEFYQTELDKRLRDFSYRIPQ